MEKCYDVRAVGPYGKCVISYENTRCFLSKEMIVPTLLKENIFDEVWSISAKLNLRLTLFYQLCKLFHIKVDE